MLTLALIGDLHYPVLENESIEFQTTRERFFSKFMNDSYVFLLIIICPSVI
ncbi:hypothetical protein [Geomicrobium sp. JCM 19055]|uniref:hypothetical protein n=1 Tax=Geomicrobium sp. JCM 19055 TaxID=1460649 RepID=UPI00045ED527|nr:hypothetical protein [Geomicrobium sp. JCM 19055]GAK01460.1 hypothetical protein JCM19055_4624 [Geomicrobium sp. JCM 19055]